MTFNHGVALTHMIKFQQIIYELRAKGCTTTISICAEDFNNVVEDRKQFHLLYEKHKDLEPGNDIIFYITDNQRREEILVEVIFVDTGAFGFKVIHIFEVAIGRNLLLPVSSFK